MKYTLRIDFDRYKQLRSDIGFRYGYRLTDNSDFSMHYKCTIDYAPITIDTQKVVNGVGVHAATDNIELVFENEPDLIWFKLKYL